MTKTVPTWARNIRRIRDERGRSAASIAGQASATLGHTLQRSSLTQVELGNRGLDVAELVAIAHALDVPVTDLLGLPGQEPPAGSDADHRGSESGTAPTAGPTTPSQPCTIAETCRCGGSTTVTADTFVAAQAAVREWRTTHPCTSRAEAEGHGKAGGSAQLGFANTVHHDPIGRVRGDLV